MNKILALSAASVFVLHQASVAALASGSIQPPPTISDCKLEKTSRIGFRVQNVPTSSIAVGLTVGFYDSKKVWLADEVIPYAGVDAPIIPIAGLFDPGQVAYVTCEVDGYISAPDQHTFISAAPISDSGQKPCSERNGLDVDGGPDAEFAAAVLGKGWIMAQFSLSINHFFPDQESEFSGDVFSASLDRRPEEKVVVSGQDPQSVSYLFTNVRPGFHQVNYGPWAVYNAVRTGSSGYSAGYHNVCLYTAVR